MNESFGDRLWDTMCSFDRMLLLLLIVTIILLALGVFSLFFVEPGSGSYLILLFDFGFLVPTFVAIILILRRCERR